MTRRIVVLAVVALLALAVGIAAGAVRLPLATLWRGLTDPTAAESVIVRQIRVPRVFLAFLVGGAILSAVRYRREHGGNSARVWGNWSIAIGALLPGIGGAFTRAGHVEVLYVGELIGLTLIWIGYRLIVGDRSESIHAAQRQAVVAT